MVIHRRVAKEPEENARADKKPAAETTTAKRANKPAKATARPKPAKSRLENKIIPVKESPFASTAEAFPPAAENFPVVGIGASGGGLNALEKFFKHLPASCGGMAFVVIQHRDPEHKGIMPRLLQGFTTMPVREVTEDLPVRPGCVYVLPANMDMTLHEGILHPRKIRASLGLYLPIDYFFRSLAEDQAEQSVGILLSGMGADGTLGLRAIKEKGGLALVQDPGDALFDEMPRTALDAGLADIVAPAASLPKKLALYLQHIPHEENPSGKTDEKAAESLRKIVAILRKHSGHDFSLYRSNTLLRRIERRMSIRRIEKTGAYIRYLRNNQPEVETLFKEILIGVTRFFRDPAYWEEFKRLIITNLLAGRKNNTVFRAWIPACSTGEEAYSLAILFKEAQEEAKAHERHSLQIFATDIDAFAVETARQGRFPANIAQDISPERLERFFTPEADGKFRVCKEIREMVIFAVQNVVMDTPFIHQDIMSCRNLLIYLRPELQRKLLQIFHYCLNPGGLLFLGGAETTGDLTDHFTPLNERSRIYKRIECLTQEKPMEFPTSFSSAVAGAPKLPRKQAPMDSIQAWANEFLLREYTPAAVLVNDKGDVLYTSGRTGKYIEPAAGKANWNIFAMVREDLNCELTCAFYKALKERSIVKRRGIRMTTETGTQTVDITIRSLDKIHNLQGITLIVFSDAAPPDEFHNSHLKEKGKEPPNGGRVTREDFLEEDTRRTHEAHKKAREELRTLQEEMLTSQEELRTANEELQSTNEELTTSKEEMQSLYEELQTVNAELQAKVDELSRTYNDMKNLLNITDIATVFLDKALNVRHFTPGATRLIKLLERDTGRPLTDLVSDLEYPELADDIRKVLKTLAPQEKNARTKDGRWFSVRLMPYRTLEDTIDGVVIIFADITRTKQLEAKLREMGVDPHADIPGLDPGEARLSAPSRK